MHTTAMTHAEVVTKNAERFKANPQPKSKRFHRRTHDQIQQGMTKNELKVLKWEEEFKAWSAWKKRNIKMGL
tara:strand:+ start:3017 stop:3232 length:216 start_codon:yes stop_codon:yes gene_type:complete